MRCEKETYPLYEKKVVSNVTTKEESEREDTKKITHVAFNAFMYVLEPILPDDGVKGDGKIASLLYLICLTTAGVVFNLSKWFQDDSKADSGVTTDHIDGFLITCICPALLWICYIFCKQSDRKTVDFITPCPQIGRAHV